MNRAMTKEQFFFIQILSDFINGRKSTLPDGLDLAQLQRYGKMHEVSGILFYQTNLPQFRSAYSYTIYAYGTRRRWIADLNAAITFPCFFVKGPEIAELYPVPGLRTMGDSDLVVHTRDREAAHQVLLAQGFENRNKQPDREWQYYKNGMEFELHDRLIYRENVNHSGQEGFFNDFWKYVEGNKLDWNFHFLYLVAHLRKHFMNQGSGFRPFMDLAIVVNRVELDWIWIEEKAREVELLPFLRNVLAFCQRWFSLQLPAPFSEQATESREDFFRQSAEKILEDGVFGFDNRANQQSEMINLYRKSGAVGVLGSVLREIFLPYRVLSAAPKYRFVRGRRYLVPIAWIYRFFSEWRKLGVKLASLRKHFVKTEARKEREDLYSRWGL